MNCRLLREQQRFEEHNHNAIRFYDISALESGSMQVTQYRPSGLGARIAKEQGSKKKCSNCAWHGPTASRSWGTEVNRRCPPLPSSSQLKEGDEISMNALIGEVVSHKASPSSSIMSDAEYTC